ncbi:MAG: alpha/beta hydrolase [Brumimicrobium sp.]|nr:alpha/beta hydrolase [Brumimicrobium sp.]MCO5269993.1 prolyl oligopeptidase family serine peptidase [Brumimicrobium sp.]
MNLHNEIYIGAEGRESLVDFDEPFDENYNDIIVFIHGYKGFKDWGAWNLMKRYFLSCNIAFCKFNLSHNGGTTEQAIDFPDLKAFSDNRYSFCLTDIKAIIDWIQSKIDISKKAIHLVGHSRGGGLSILAASDPRVKSVITLASIASIESQFPKGEALDKWKEDGYFTVQNSRTQQEMPIRYSIYEDWESNKDLLNIEETAKKLNLPALHIHGDIDESVYITESEKLSTWTQGKLIIISNANHTFNSYHPYEKEDMPSKLYETCILISQFIESL